MSLLTRISRPCETTFNSCVRRGVNIATTRTPIRDTAIAINNSYRRTTVIDRQPTLPAASLARMVTVLSPTSSGTSPVDQELVPAARPELPVEVLHRTSTTPILSFAVPL